MKLIEKPMRRDGKVPVVFIFNNGDQDQDGAWPPSQATLRSDRRLAREGLSVVRFSSGHVMTQNSRGRCEDAPCCGCCP